MSLQPIGAREQVFGMNLQPIVRGQGASVWNGSPPTVRGQGDSVELERQLAAMREREQGSLARQQ